MKLKWFFVVILIFSLLLTACTATDPDNLFGSVPEDTSSEDIMYYTGAYQYGNMQKNIPSGNFMLLNNEVVFYPSSEGPSILCSYDLLTGEVRPFCKDATCKHATCVSGSILGNVEVYNGKLYGKNADFDIEITTYPVVANGNETEVIINADVNTFFHHDDKLYLKTPDSSLLVLEEGQKEPQVILEEYTCYKQVIFENYLYANRPDDNIIRVDLSAEQPAEEIIIPNAGGITDGEHIYYVDGKTSQLFRCDMDGKNTQLLVEEPVLLASINFDDEYFYYRLFTDGLLHGSSDSRDIYRFPKEDPTQIEKIVTLQESAYQVFTVPGTGKIFVSNHVPLGEERVIYVMGTDGSNPTKLELPEY